MSSDSHKIWQIKVQGVVQSVGFRPFIKNLGDEFSLLGTVRNCGDAGVEIVVKCNEEELHEFMRAIRERKPELALITRIDYKESRDRHSLHDLREFTILPSKTSRRSQGDDSVSVLPPDICICEECINDMLFEPKRKYYSFTSCTNCGPRYTAIESLPYDRPNTSFREFPLCSSCENEYKDPKNRRFHAQTTCCSQCGPHYFMHVNQSGAWVQEPINWKFISSSLQEGKTWTIMGLGGTHFALNALDQDLVSQFRKIRRKRSNKPFAVMMRDLETVEKYCDLSSQDIKLLTSSRRPIIIVPVKDPELWNAVSPGLTTLGVMLPYTGVHYNLFWHGSPEALVMTSANAPGIPMPITPNQVLALAKQYTDGALIHNRRIIQRVDDSVLRSHGETHVLIRRSRGYVPQPHYHEELSPLTGVIAFGAEESNTAAIAKKGWIIPTQHLGHITNQESLDFELTAITHLLDLFKITPQLAVRDYHPTFLTTSMADDFAANFKLPILSVPHHVAHAASLMLDHGLSINDSILVWTLDGFGLGIDDQAWGGELILIQDRKWQRVSSLLPIRYDGGDQNARYPARMLTYYLLELGEDPLAYFSNRVESVFKHGIKELEFLIHSSKREPRLVTTSLGRLLDSLSILLGACQKRTYRGEPAIRFEGLALRGSYSEPVKPFILEKQGKLFLDNLSLLEHATTLLTQGISRSTIANWAHKAIGVSLGELARIQAETNDVGHIGISGGVANNFLITQALKHYLKENSIELLTHVNVPAGDAGISTGQIMYARMVHYDE